MTRDTRLGRVRVLSYGPAGYPPPSPWPSRCRAARQTYRAADARCWVSQTISDVVEHRSDDSHHRKPDPTLLVDQAPGNAQGERPSWRGTMRARSKRQTRRPVSSALLAAEFDHRRGHPYVSRRLIVAGDVLALTSTSSRAHALDRSIDLALTPIRYARTFTGNAE